MESASVSNWHMRFLHLKKKTKKKNTQVIKNEYMYVQVLKGPGTQTDSRGRRGLGGLEKHAASGRPRVPLSLYPF